MGDTVIARKLRSIAKRVPFLTRAYQKLADRYVYYRLKSKGTEQLFTHYYRKNVWGGISSVSGRGSDTQHTRLITREVQALLREMDISKILDIPCGDFYWMKDVDLSKVHYIGADIVDDLIRKNAAKYAEVGMRFEKLNIIKDRLPQVDLILCRDCLVHFSFVDVLNALENICKSQSKYLLTTTFSRREHNRDIATGQWRTLNLEIPPFNLPTPVRLLNEGCTEHDGAYADKALGLWRISDIRKELPGVATTDSPN